MHLSVVCANIDASAGMRVRVMYGLRGLGLWMQAEDFAVSSGVFANVAPCQPLLDILTDTPELGSNLGNFTEQPSEEVLRDCTDNNSAYLLQGTALADALRQAEPKLKVRTVTMFCSAQSASEVL